ncbi:polysaccharide deacetylase family protein [Vibrio coralliilyticus]|uniref:polysaccharide deacetylase family protein n=1 Tax=Vibrio coralliilyticus TaxID=190893 RepID=UPI00148D4462|nr:polysaccharide deacetylase family protein [Vibrio coralliilyticus]NOI30726.1 polysaccharide deacetylase family protein [Vibrio coralliilyticus]NOI49727.1 polysaccharide deacetylase family protein [Vibrio coralliilyticus]
MNILMALSQLEVTGAEVYATTVGNQLTKRGHTVHYVSDTLTKPFLGQFFKLRFNKRSIPRRFWHIAYLIYLIKKHNIQLVHSHSRASSWSCHVACKITGTPMVTTVHGRQPVHRSRKAFHAMGDKSLPVCEAIKQQLIEELNVPSSQMTVCRNGIETEAFSSADLPKNEKPIVTIIGRLTGPKGDLCFRLLDDCLDLNKYEVQILTGSAMEARFEKFEDKAKFLGYTDNVARVLHNSDLVIGAGRVAMESLLCGRPTLAVGEAICVGMVSEENLAQAMSTNFGDIGPQDLDIDFKDLAQQVEQGLRTRCCSRSVTKTILQNYDISNIVSQLENIYQDVVVDKLKREMPIIMYHRFIRDDSEKGVHGTYLHVDMLEKHLKLLQLMGFETLTFKDMTDKGLIHRLQANKRYVMLTVDDGYQDNYELMLPLLKKYGFKAVIYVVTGEAFNRWDVESPDNPEKAVPLMQEAQIKALHHSGCVEIGGHTSTHPFLSKLSYHEQYQEISENKKRLETLLGEPLTSFAYPYGDLNEDSKEIVQELGYKFAVATNSGPLATHRDKFQIRRIAIFPKTDVLGLWRKIRGNYVFRKARKNQ